MKLSQLDPRPLNPRQQQLRKVAILITTLDPSLTEQLLADLPASEAAAVRKVAAELIDVDPQERQAVAQAFKQGIASPAVQDAPRLDGVELDASLLARISQDAPEDFPEQETPSSRFWHTLSDSDSATLVEMLGAEQPQTIALVLAQLEPARSAELLAKFSPLLQTEVLHRLAELDPADQRSLEVVQAQLAEWISAQRKKRQRMAVGCELVQRILQDTPAEQRAVLVSQLKQRNPSLGDKLSDQNPAAPAWGRATKPPVKLRPPRGYSPVAPPLAPRTAPLAAQPVEQETGDPLSELEALDDRGLLQALRLADRDTVLLALAGASQGLLRRIVQGLPRRSAKEFRQQIRSVGPVRLQDMLTAQRELVRLGHAP
jgi:flagellar motor switch protein FliG